VAGDQSQVYAALRQIHGWALTSTGMEAEIKLETTPSHPVLIGYDMMSSAVVTILEVRTCAKSEVSSIDEPPKPKVDVQESISNAKIYCKQNTEGIVTIVRCWIDISSYCFSQLQLCSQSRPVCLSHGLTGLGLWRSSHRSPA
jgi:hypothetical protein